MGSGYLLMRGLMRDSRPVCSRLKPRVLIEPCVQMTSVSCAGEGVGGY
jgi:hypothetical protein